MKKFIQSVFLLIIGLSLVGVVYGGVGVIQAVRASDNASKTQQALTQELLALQDQVESQNAAIGDLQNKLSEVQKLASEPKQILGTTTAQPAPAPAPEPVVQTVTKTKTVYVKEAPKKQATVTIKGVGSFTVEITAGETAFSLLKKAAAQNGFSLDYQQYDFGVFVTAIGGIVPAGNQYWAFYFNGQYSMVGASDQPIASGDTTFWQLESF